MYISQPLQHATQKSFLQENGLGGNQAGLPRKTGLQTGRFEMLHDQDNSLLQAATVQINGTHAHLRTREDLVSSYA